MLRRGALLGAVGGIVAGALDFALALPRAASFLPSGQTRLLVFLCALYGAAAALAGALLGGVAAALGWGTDLGPLWRASINDEEPREGATFLSYAIAVALAGVALGFATHTIAAQSLRIFHHRLLIAGLVGGSAALLAIPGAALVFLLAPALSLVLRKGPRARLRLAAPPAVAAAAWTLGLLTAAAAVALVLFALQQKSRMTPPLKALNTALWAPPIVLASLVAWHFLARALRRFDSPWLRKPSTALVAIAISFALPFSLAAILQWSTVRQLDARPWLSLLVAVVVSLSLASRLRTPPRWFWAAPIALLILALVVGRSDRVRKSAIAYTGSTGPLVQALHLVTDLDRDGHASVLGGGDCDDVDRAVHPGAFDWPDDGIDQNCNGHQATLAATAERKFAPFAGAKDFNVLLLTIDALRADHVGAYGYARATTPNLDALAREGVLFKNGWAHAPSTRYSVPAILTGRYPSTIAVGSAWWPPDVLPSNRMIAEILKERGYRTATFLPYYYFDRRWGLDQGFDDYDVRLQNLHSMGGDPAATHGSSAKELANLDVEWLAAHKDEKFFLWSHYYDTHYHFERHGEPETNFGNTEIDLYDGEIRYTDIQLGRVFDALKTHGLWDQTIIVITADHGDGFGEHGIPRNRRHGYHLYSIETKVPFIVRVPGVAPRRVEAPVGHIDLLPTILNAIGAPNEPQLLGESLLPLMLGSQESSGEPSGARRGASGEAVPSRMPASRDVYQEVWYEGPTSKKAVVGAQHHLIRNLIPDDTTELYDLAADPSENVDLAGRGTDAERALSAKLGAWMDQTALPADFKRKVEGNVAKSALPFSTPLGDTLGDAITIDGVDVKTATVKRGAQAELSLILRGRGSLDEGWVLFTHLIAQNGQRINADHQPLEGLFPLERISSGIWLRDNLSVPIPAGWPPGPLTVEVGLWRRAGRAPARGKHAHNDAVRVATLEVTP